MYQFITEKNKFTLNKPQDSDRIYYSELNEWYTTDAFRAFSIKFVLENSIRYRTQDADHEVKANHFLLAVKQPGVTASFQSKNPVRSICIDVCPATVGSVFTLLSDRSEPELDAFCAGHFRYPDFYETISPVEGSPGSAALKTLQSAIRANKTDIRVDAAWMYSLVEDVLTQQYGHYLRYQNIRSLRASTRKEIYRRLSIALQYMQENFTQIDNTKEIAQACHMSEYHFLRSFRQAFQITPYQFLQEKRLEHAVDLMKNKELKLTHIAAVCGFSDIFTFSKAFKRKYGVAPSGYLVNGQ